MADPISRSSANRFERAVSALGVLGAVALSVQATSPMGMGPHAPAWFNWPSLILLAAWLLLRARRGAPDERWIAGWCSFATLYFVGITQPWNSLTTLELASSFSRVLSSTWHGFAAFALLASFSVVGLGSTAARTVLALSNDGEALHTRILAWLIALVVAVFGLRGLIGYATGNVSLVSF